MNKPVYLLIGSGRLARHFTHYFTQMGMECLAWSRQDADADLKSSLDRCTHVLILIKDEAIEKFITAHPQLLTRILIHCSGSLSLPGVYGAHPLMTFNERLYSLPVYQSIPFVVESAGDLKTVFPLLPNAEYVVPPQQKALYHALCSAGGNLSVVLWQQVFKEFRDQLQLPPGILIPYLRQTFFNLADNPDTALTGPLSRQDWRTVDRHLDALKESPLREIYQAFVHMHLGRLAQSEVSHGP